MRALGVAFAVVLVVAACSGAAAPSQPTTPSATPRPGGRAVLPIGNVMTLQPLLAANLITEVIYSPLVGRDPDTGALVPELADRFGLSSDGLTATYHLRDGLVWSDGVPITGEDYRYVVHALARSKQTTQSKVSFQDIVGWRDYVEGRTSAIAGIDVSADGRTITVKVTRVLCTTLGGLVSYPLPRHRFQAAWDDRTTDASKSIDEHPLNLAPPVSSGPFVLRDRGQEQTVLVANDRYWRGRPLLDELVFKTYAGSAPTLNAIRAEEVDAAWPIAPEDLESVTRGASAYQAHRVAGISNFAFIGWNQISSRAPWLRDARVRRALSHGLDVDRIIQAVLLGNGHRVYSHVPQASWAYDGTGFDTYSYDVAGAKRLLEAAGARMGPDGVYLWTDGRPMRMTIETNQGNTVRERIMEIAAEQYAKIGISIDQRLESFPALVAHLNDHGTDFDGVIVGWNLSASDPGMYAIWHSSQAARGGSNFVAYADPEVDRLVEQARTGPDCSQDARRRAFAAADRILNRDVPYTFLFAADTLAVSHRSLRGFELKPFASMLWNVERWWIRR